MKWTDRIFVLANTAGVLLCLFLVLCTNPAHDTAHTETIRIYDSTERYPAPVSAPGTVSFYPITSASTVLVTADTALLQQVAAAFYAAHTYTQEFRDTSISIHVRDSVTQNRIAGRQLRYKLLQPAKTVESSTVYAQVNRAGLYFGGFGDLQLGSGIGLGPRLSFQTRRNLVISYDYDLKNKGHRVGLQQRIQW